MRKPFASPFFSSRNFTILLTILTLHFGVWWLFNRPLSPESDWVGTIHGISFSPYQHGQDPYKQRHPGIEDLRGDLRLLQKMVREVRTYGSTRGLERIPGLANEFGLQVTAGAWLGTDRENNSLEIRNLVFNANRHRNIKQLIVGNEALLRGDLTIAELRRYLRKVRAKTAQPVSTAEPWHVWMKHPELAEDVDFIAIHILPYWERIPADKAVQWALDRYMDVTHAFPGKRILVAEIGWPSHGERQGAAKPGRDTQAMFLRQFLPLAHEYGIDYYVMEAFDQPWKRPREGVVGGYWGIYDLYRKAKVAWAGPIPRSATWQVECLIASMFGMFLLAGYLGKRRGAPWSAILLFGLLLQTTVAMLVWYTFAPAGESFTTLEMAAWLGLFPLNLTLLLVILINGFEMERLLAPKRLQRDFSGLKDHADAMPPKVSLHVAICNEPPDIVLQTLSSLDALDYPDFEVLVVDNNTGSADLWRPVRDFCRARGSRFRFYHLRKSKGFKAGALNFALSQTHPEAVVVGVVDSDYMVRPDWLKNLVPLFARDANLALVQAPQDHRLWQGNPFKEMCNWEYAGFFKIGMVHRNEDNAIIQHGTMTLIRHAALRDAGGWSAWCICEDAELGLRLMARGHSSIYVPESYGWGLTPDTFSGYCSQRFRWAYGAVQILKRHWRSLLPWGRQGRLTLGQKYHYFAGWLPWFTDGVHLVCVSAGLVWAAGMLLLPQSIGTPMALLLLPMLASFAFRPLHFIWLYQVRVRCGLLRTLGAALAGTALMHTIGKAMISGIFTSNKPFLRTPKCESNSGLVRGAYMAGQEAVLALLLWSAALGLAQRYGFEDGDINLWMTILVIQSVPYLAALFVSMAGALPGTPRKQWVEALEPPRMLRLRPGSGAITFSGLLPRTRRFWTMLLGSVPKR